MSLTLHYENDTKNINKIRTAFQITISILLIILIADAGIKSYYGFSFFAILISTIGFAIIQSIGNTGIGGDINGDISVYLDARINIITYMVSVICVVIYTIYYFNTEISNSTYENIEDKYNKKTLLLYLKDNQISEFEYSEVCINSLIRDLLNQIEREELSKIKKVQELEKAKAELIKNLQNNN